MHMSEVKSFSSDPSTHFGDGDFYSIRKCDVIFSLRNSEAWRSKCLSLGAVQ